MNVVLLPFHMGALHPYETVLTLLLAFGPFVLLGLVIVLRRRQDERQERRERENGDAQRER